ncbi:MAG: T9SS type A sorting domain-containing protein [Flammeovirgaceae bacterium]|nr:MAG: T9SS type A sorting domain-containing protein [Flammeovirgaceae bacterium]
MKNVYSWIFIGGSLLLTNTRLQAQQFMGIKIKDHTVCYGHTTNHDFYVPPPEEYVQWKTGARTKTANIQVNYNGFTAQAQAAFQFAVDIWASLITSSQTITIDAYWQPLGAGILGGAIYTSAFANFDGAQKLNVFYPVALAEKMAGKNLNGTNSEIFTQFSSSANWHLDPGSPPPAGTFDLVTVVLHEIGHGLGFSGSFKILSSNGQGEVGVQSTGVPIIYDVPIKNGSNINLIEGFASPSSQLAGQLTSSSLFFDTPNSTNSRLFAPSTFSSGSSISHLDEATFNGTGDALMTPQIAPQERILAPGVALNMLNDMGWQQVFINHQALPNTENVTGPYTVTALVTSDNGFNAGTLRLNYTTDGNTFTQVTMAPTGLPNEYSAVIPSTGTPTTYGYFISVNDNNNRQFVKPGKFVRKQNTQLQALFVFEAGPDTKAPIISHSQKPFLLDTDTHLDIEARVTDNIGVASVVLEYLINDVPQTGQSFTLQNPGEDSIYRTTVNLGTGLANGDVLKYRIIATDNSSNSNQRTSPATGHYVLNVVGLAPTQNSYANDFNTPSDDFFGVGFSITTPSGFNNPAIHTTHPYPEGQGFPGGEYNYLYQLKVPIRIKAQEATLKFDEIVLVEPGEPGTVFGDPQFWDYVVVEGSKDGGFTWVPVANGYDSRDFSPWLTRYNSAISGNNSTAVGDPTLFRTRTLDLQNQFDTGDEVVIRFRLYSDQLAAGWGWCIDNLKIQIDETPPKILHNHTDYLKDEDDVLVITTAATDASGVESLKVEYNINGGAATEIEFDVDPPAATYTFSLAGLSTLPAGNFVEYRLAAVDSAGNTTTLPSSGFFKVPIINFSTPIATYANNFNSATTDFVGNFFSVAQPTGFSNSALHSEHPYSNGFGLDQTTNYTITLLKPITIASSNSLMRFDEIAIIEPTNLGIPFGSPNFKDYVIIEGSKDGGQTWLHFLDGYNARENSAWLGAYNTGSTPTPALFRTRLLDLKASGNFNTGDNVIIRFRLFATSSVNAWGWAIDNLYIQDATTGLENELASAIQVFPNPVVDWITIEASGLDGNVSVSMVNLQGQSLHYAEIQPEQGAVKHSINTSALPSGLYLLKLKTAKGTVIKKVAKVNR